MNLKKESDGVYFATDSIVAIDLNDLDFLKIQAFASLLNRARICAHKSKDDTLHEMIIVLGSQSYIQPHRHINKSESFHIVEGCVDVVILDEHGGITEVVELGDLSTGRKFFYRLSCSRFHTLLIRSEYVIIHEVTNGPFLKEETILASFAPSDSDVQQAAEYLAKLSDKAIEFTRPNT
jgi:cupin fold WbuC family metalloprotein